MSTTTKSSTTEGSVESKNGTLHVRVLKAKGLPVDYQARQDPFVLIQLEGSTPKSWGTTDPAFQGGANPEWQEDQNREVELYFDGDVHTKEAILTFEMYSDESGENLLGTGQINVFKVAQDKLTEGKPYTVRLKDTLGGTVSRGEVQVEVWYGPAIRKAFRAAQRISKVLDVRDSVVSSIWSIGFQAAAPLSKHLQGPIDYVKKNRALSMALAAVLGIMAAGAASLFLLFAIPTATIALFTFPFWIIPFMTIALFTSPFWIPVVLLVGLFLAFVSAVFVGLGVTSRPIRRQGALLSQKIKQSDVGKRVLYEKSA